MSVALYDEVCDALKSRQSWEDKQALYIRMRNEGLERKNRQGWQSQLHYPQIDIMISKAKPFYLQQVYAGPTLATFVPRVQMMNPETRYAVEEAFDYFVKEESEFEQEIEYVVDRMLVSKGVLKTSWDAERERLRFEAVDPVYCVVPIGTRRVHDAEWVCHVKHYSKREYRGVAQFRQDEDFVERIAGRGRDEAGGMRRDDRLHRSGLTEVDSSDFIVVWEVYERVREQGVERIEVHTFSPTCPEEPVRAMYVQSYGHGQMPFVDFNEELTEVDYYGSRGVAERQAPFEAYLCKVWNEKSDVMAFTNKPVFVAGAELPQTQNLRMSPGQILPYGLQRMQMPEPPISFDQEMLNTRYTAEAREMMPDFGMGQQTNAKEPRSATEVNNVMQLGMQGVAAKARPFRRSLALVYRQAFSLLFQFKRGVLEYLWRGKLKALPSEAWMEAYVIHPRGSADGVNRAVEYSKAVARFQMFRGDPYVNQAELRKSVLAADSAELVDSLFTDPNEEAADQAEHQAEELAVMRLGFPARVQAVDDHVVHVQTLLGYMESKVANGLALEPGEQQMMLQHIQAHLQALKERDSKAGGMLMMEVKARLERLVQPVAEQQAAREEVQDVR